MAPEPDAKAVVAGLIEEVWRWGDLEALPRFFTDDCVNHAAAPGHQEGLAALFEYHLHFSEAFADFDDVRIAIDDQVAEGDRVCTRLTTTATHRPTGRAGVLATIRIDRLEGGRIAEHWSVADLAGLAGQLQPGD